jgi:hypothetical protein
MLLAYSKQLRLADSTIRRPGLPGSGPQGGWNPASMGGPAGGLGCTSLDRRVPAPGRDTREGPFASLCDFSHRHDPVFELRLA